MPGLKQYVLRLDVPVDDVEGLKLPEGVEQVVQHHQYEVVAGGVAGQPLEGALCVLVAQFEEDLD